MLLSHSAAASPWTPAGQPHPAGASVCVDGGPADTLAQARL